MQRSRLGTAIVARTAQRERFVVVIERALRSPNSLSTRPRLLSAVAKPLHVVSRAKQRQRSTEVVLRLAQIAEQLVKPPKITERCRFKVTVISLRVSAAMPDGSGRVLAEFRQACCKRTDVVEHPALAATITDGVA